MTKFDLPEVGTALVVADGRPECPGDPCIDVRPGLTSWRDADTRGSRLAVGYAGETWSVRDTELNAVVEVADEWLSAGTATGVRLGDRTRLHATMAPGTVDRLERRLASCVREHEALLVTWTDGQPRDRDHDLYDAVCCRR